MRTGGVIVCNGYKDREFIELAMAGTALGYQVFVVVEKMSELDLLIKVAKEAGLRPKIGIRIRLATVGSGNWQNQLIQHFQPSQVIPQLQLQISKHF